MGLFNGYLKEGKGVEKDAPKPIRPIYFFELFFRKFSKMIQLNLLFILTTLPFWAIVYFLASYFVTNAAGDTATFSNAMNVVSQVVVNPLSMIVLLLLSMLLGPSTAGATYILMNYANEMPVFLCSDYFEAFKKNFKQASILMAFNILAGMSTFITWFIPMVPAYAQNSSTALLTYFRIPSLVVFLVMIFANFYAYTIMVKFYMKLKDIIKNSFIFALGRLPQNLLTLAIIVAVCYFAFSNFLIGMLVLILLLYAFCGFLTVFSVYPTIEKYMLIPTLKNDKTKETDKTKEFEQSEI